MSEKHEQEYFDALRKIAKEFHSPETLKKAAEKQYGLGPEEAIEMAYENIQGIAASAIRGRSRPKIKERASAVKSKSIKF